jgi:AcrR family transcriptional regulator
VDRDVDEFELGVARGRHAPPPEVRLPLQRQRLLRAAAAEFAARGYAQTGADSISRRAKMSKATFYAHFANKEDCMLALIPSVIEILQPQIMAVAGDLTTGTPVDRIRAAINACLAALAEFPAYFQTIFVESLAAGPRAAAIREETMQSFADFLDARNAAAAREGQISRFISPHDSYALIGAIAELLSRHVIRGVPEDPFELAPVIERLILGVLHPTGAPSGN